MDNISIVSPSPDETFAIAEKLGEKLSGGEAILLSGGLGAGKTLFTKGILNALDFDIDEVTSPSFALGNLYKTERGRLKRRVDCNAAILAAVVVASCRHFRVNSGRIRANL